MPTSWGLGKVPPGDWLTLSDGNPYERCTALACQVEGSITRLRWRRMTTSAGDKPDTLQLWDHATETLLYTASVVPDNGAVGWQVHDCDPPVSVDAGQIVLPSMEVPASTTTGYLNIASSYPPPDFPAGYALPPYRRSTAPAYGFPDYLDTAYLMAVDAEFTGFLPSGSWEMVAETDYTDGIKWTQPADKYRLDVTTIVQWRVSTVVAGEDIRRVVGAWWPFSEGFKGQRLLIDAPKSELAQPNGRRMDGLLLDTGVGSEGHLQAFVLA